VQGAAVPLTASRAAVGEEDADAGTGVEMVDIHETATSSQVEAEALGAAVAETKLAEEAKSDEVTDTQREAYAAGHAVASEAFPELPDDEE